jgi:hypothetical protein
MRITAPDGRRWRTGRRWLPWRPRPPRLLSYAWHAATGIGDLGEILGAVALAAAVVVLPVLALALLAYLLEWLACLLLAPFAVLIRFAAGRPWTVVASTRGRGLYQLDADTFHDAGILATRVSDEISYHGTPASLTPPPPPTPVRVEDLGPVRRKLLARFPSLGQRPQR